MVTSILSAEKRVEKTEITLEINEIPKCPKNKKVSSSSTIQYINGKPIAIHKNINICKKKKKIIITKNKIWDYEKYKK